MKSEAWKLSFCLLACLLVSGQAAESTINKNQNVRVLSVKPTEAPLMKSTVKPTVAPIIVAAPTKSIVINTPPKLKEKVNLSENKAPEDPVFESLDSKLKISPEGDTLKSQQTVHDTKPVQVTGFLTKNGNIYEIEDKDGIGMIEGRQNPVDTEMNVCNYGSIVIYSDVPCEQVTNIHVEEPKPKPSNDEKQPENEQTQTQIQNQNQNQNESQDQNQIVEESAINAEGEVDERDDNNNRPPRRRNQQKRKRLQQNQRKRKRRNKNRKNSANRNQKRRRTQSRPQKRRRQQQQQKNRRRRLQNQKPNTQQRRPNNNNRPNRRVRKGNGNRRRYSNGNNVNRNRYWGQRVQQTRRRQENNGRFDEFN